MKKRTFLLVLLAMFLCLTSCKKTESPETVSVIEKETEENNIVFVPDDTDINLDHKNESDSKAADAGDNYTDNVVENEDDDMISYDDVDNYEDSNPYLDETISLYEMTEYERFLIMSAAEQAEFVESFSNPMDFITWYNNAEAEYNEKKPAYEITGDVIDGNDVAKNNG